LKNALAAGALPRTQLGAYTLPAPPPSWTKMEGKAKEDEGTRQEREWKGQEVWERDRGGIKGEERGK